MTKKNKYYSRYKRSKKKKIKDRSNRKRKYLVDIDRCIQLNKKFEESNAHHINRNLVIFIPIELHQHVIHNMRTGFGMAIINLLAFQFLFGGLDGDFLEDFDF